MSQKGSTVRDGTSAGGLSFRVGRRKIIWPLLLASALVLSGCANPVESAIAQASDALSSGPSEEVAPTETNEKRSDSGTAEIPSNFPDGVPLPSQKPTSAAHHTKDGVDVWALQYHDLEGPAEFDSLCEELLSQGFVEESNTSMGDKMRIALYADDQHTVNLSLLGDEGERILQVMVMNQVAQ